MTTKFIIFAISACFMFLVGCAQHPGAAKTAKEADSFGNRLNDDNSVVIYMYPQVGNVNEGKYLRIPITATATQ